ncbi:MAG: YggT family protein [Treponema sp.]|nr:YggT family protein [Treponema sp.]
MRFIFGVLAAAAGIYSILILIRIILSWFGNSYNSKPAEILQNITDPYLNWWRGVLKLRIGFLDFSVVVAIVFLSLLQNIFYTLSLSQRMTLGFILAEILTSVWSIMSFIIGFFMIIILLRAAAYLTNRNIYSPFWSIVENISQPLMYRMNRLFFGKKIGNYLAGIIFAFLLLAVILTGGWLFVNFLAGLLKNIPI